MLEKYSGKKRKNEEKVPSVPTNLVSETIQKRKFYQNMRINGTRGSEITCHARETMIPASNYS
jgi:hypothetical protein